MTWTTRIQDMPPGPPPEEDKQQKEKLEKAAQQHAQLMYANNQLLKAIRYAAFAMGLGIIALVGYTWLATRSASPAGGGAPPPPPYTPPAPPPAG